MSSHSEYARIGIGCMRLSTERDRDDERGIEVLHAGLDLGVRFLDTADAYCLDDSETGHNERPIASPARSVRKQPEGARHRAHRSLSASRDRSACALLHERACTRSAEG